MGSSDQVQHVFPAGLIGQFATAEARGTRPRDKAVWVASRRSPHPFLRAAKSVGFDPQVPRAYTSVEGIDFDFDLVLSQSEFFIGHLKDLGPRVRRDARIDSAHYVAGLIPLVAGLLSRSPQLGLGDTSPLDPSSLNQESLLEERVQAFARALYVLSFQTTVMIVRDINDGLITNDTGYVWGVAPEGTSEVFLPINPSYALVLLVGGPANVDAHAPHASILCVDWSPDVLDIRKWLLARHARREAYASTKQTAQLILDRQAAPPDPETAEGIPLEMPFPPEAWAEFLRKDAPSPQESLMAWLALREAVGAPLEPSAAHLDADTRESFLDRVAQTSIPPRERRPSWEDLGGYTGYWRVRPATAEEFTWAYVPKWP